MEHVIDLIMQHSGCVLGVRITNSTLESEHVPKSNAAEFWHSCLYSYSKTNALQSPYHKLVTHASGGSRARIGEVSMIAKGVSNMILLSRRVPVYTLRPCDCRVTASCPLFYRMLSHTVVTQHLSMSDIRRLPRMPTLVLVV